MRMASFRDHFHTLTTPSLPPETITRCSALGVMQTSWTASRWAVPPAASLGPRSCRSGTPPRVEWRTVLPIPPETA